MPPLFSVIIPCRNSERTIELALKSVFSQACQKFECIVVDDGSDDATCRLVRQFPDVKLIKQERRGPGAARNTGAAAARGQFLAFLDSDDLWFPWTLANYAAVLAGSGGAFVSGAGVEVLCTDAVDVPEAELVSEAFADYLVAGAAGMWVGTCGVVVLRSLYLSVGGFSELPINGEDSDLWIRLGCAPGFVRIHSPPSFVYRRSEGSATSQIEKSYLGCLHMIENERRGHYPGGREREGERAGIIGSHVRPVCVRMAALGHVGRAMRLYTESIGINLRGRRFRFLVGLPFAAACGVARKGCGAVVSGVGRSVRRSSRRVTP